MSHTIRFKLTSKQSEAILQVINILNGAQNRPVSIDEFAKMCTIQATREILMSLQSQQQSQETENGQQVSPNKQESGTQDASGNVQGSGMAPISGTVSSIGEMGSNNGTEP